MEISIGSNVECEPSLAFAPRRVRHRAAMVVPLRGRAFHRKCAKAVFTPDGIRGSRQSGEIERSLPDQLTRSAKRGRCEIVCAYEVAVAARNRAIAGVKLIMHFEGCRNPYIVRKNGVHRSSESERAPLLRHAHSRCLATRVNPRICSPGPCHGERRSTQPRHRRLEDSLDSSFGRLPLPAGKARAIIVQHELHGTRQHRVIITRERVAVKERNPLKMIDFRLSTRQCGPTRAPLALSR